MSGILLVTINAKWIHPSLALRLLKANCGDLEDRCEILEFALRQPLEEKVGPVLAARPRLLGLSVSIWNHSATLELLAALEEEWDEKPIVVLGGPEVSWLNEDAEIFRYADYVIRGEAEESFRLLCYKVFYGENLPPDVLVSKTESRGKETVIINRGDSIADVNKIVPAYRLYTDEDLQKKLVYVEASRGCPFGCEFCQASFRKPVSLGKQASVGSGGTRPVREFPLESFLADMDTLIERGGRQFKFLDRTFNLDMEPATGPKGKASGTRAKRIMEFFLDRIEAQGTGTANVSPLCVHFEMVPSRFHPELRETIRRFPPGTLRLEIGIQTFNSETAALVHRAGDMAEELEILEFLRQESNAIVHIDLIAGLPGEGLASFGAGFDKLWQVISGNSSGGGRFEIQLGILKCLPGTPIARHNEACGMKYSAVPPYEVMETAALSSAELAKLKNFARLWELIVNRNYFPELIGRQLPPGKAVFEKFMDLSDQLLRHFGRNWGIDRSDLKLFLEGFNR